MFSRRGSSSQPLTASSAVELRDMDIFVFTRATGLLGSLVGRNLKLRVDRFAIDFFRGDQNRVNIVQVRCAANSLLALSEVDKNRFDRVPLTYEECVKVDRKTRLSVLDAERYPEIVYTIQQETSTDIIGTLELKGMSNMVKCTKRNEGAELVVQCPIQQSLFGSTPVGALLNTLRVADDVFVEARVPTKYL